MFTHTAFAFNIMLTCFLINSSELADGSKTRISLFVLVNLCKSLVVLSSGSLSSKIGSLGCLSNSLYYYNFFC